MNWSKDHWKSIVESDAKGYYAYLPAVFIYHDLNYTFLDTVERKKYFDENLFYDYTTGINGKRVDRYWCGTAICELPFFLTSHLLTKLSHGDSDGFSRLYPIGINIAGIFYLLIGLWFLNKLLQTYSINGKNRLLTLLVIFFGTNLYYYTTSEPGMSHVYSFSMISVFLFQLRSCMLNFRKTNLIIAAITLGIIFLIRPLNILVALLTPFLANNTTAFKTFFRKIIKDIKTTIIALVACLLIMNIQFVIYKISCGNFFVDSYPGEHFNFLKPHFADILFSFKKGLFIYTPVYFLSLFGLLTLKRSHPFAATSFLLFFLLITYIFSCWWSWWFGGSFSGRTFIDFLPAFAICLAMLFQHTSGYVKYSAIGLGLVLTIFCQLQTWQYRYEIIHWENMTKEKYFEVFMKFKK